MSFKSHLLEVQELVAERDNLRAEVERLRPALAELVTLKDGPRDAAYERRKPLAWQAAREALNPTTGQPNTTQEAT